MANSDNASNLPIIGAVMSDGKQEGNDIRADVNIWSLPTDARELSCGYKLNLDETPGITPDGQHYDAIQRDIRYNHLAVVQRGRAGNARLNMDGDQYFDEYNDDADLTTEQRKKLPKSVFGLPEKMAYPMPDRSHAANAKARAAQQLKAGGLTQEEYDKIIKKANAILERKDGMDKIRLDSGIEYECAPEVKVAVEKLRNDISQAGEEKSVLQAKYDVAISDMEKIKKEKDDFIADQKKNFDSAVNDRIEMVETAKKHNIENFDGMSNKDIKIAVIKSVYADKNLDGKDDSYIQAMFDMAKENKSQHQDTMQQNIQTINKKDSFKKNDNFDEFDYEEKLKKLREDEAKAYLGGNK